MTSYDAKRGLPQPSFYEPNQLLGITRTALDRIQETIYPPVVTKAQNSFFGNLETIVAQDNFVNIKDQDTFRFFQGMLIVQAADCGLMALRQSDPNTRYTDPDISNPVTRLKATEAKVLATITEYYPLGKTFTDYHSKTRKAIDLCLQSQTARSLITTQDFENALTNPIINPGILHSSIKPTDPIILITQTGKEYTMVGVPLGRIFKNSAGFVLDDNSTLDWNYRPFIRQVVADVQDANLKTTQRLFLYDRDSKVIEKGLLWNKHFTGQ